MLVECCLSTADQHGVLDICAGDSSLPAMPTKQPAKGQPVTILDVQPPLGVPWGACNRPGRLTGRRKPNQPSPLRPAGFEVEIHMAGCWPPIWLPQQQVPELQGDKANHLEFEEVPAELS